MGRAVAHGKTPVPRFDDPTARALLPEEVRSRVDRVREGGPPKGLRARFGRSYMEGQSNLMALRTVAIDDSIREAGLAQVVILGAGLDGRAFRMSELSGAVVFEVDHPDSQREKRERAHTLTQTAREVRYVPVDFEKDSLAEALEKAGHDPSRPTMWLWEGVVMYLVPRDIEATLAVIGRRSAPKSRLVVAYHSPALLLLAVGFVVRRLGEPLRSTQTPAQIEALFGRHGFSVVRDETIADLGAKVSPVLAKKTKFLTHLRIVTADRA